MQPPPQRLGLHVRAHVLADLLLEALPAELGEIDVRVGVQAHHDGHDAQLREPLRDADQRGRLAGAGVAHDDLHVLALALQDAGRELVEQAGARYDLDRLVVLDERDGVAADVVQHHAVRTPADLTADLGGTVGTADEVVPHEDQQAEHGAREQ